MFGDDKGIIVVIKGGGNGMNRCDGSDAIHIVIVSNEGEDYQNVKSYQKIGVNLIKINEQINKSGRKKIEKTTTYRYIGEEEESEYSNVKRGNERDEREIEMR